jgi:hypothetical protein
MAPVSWVIRSRYTHRHSPSSALFQTFCQRKKKKKKKEVISYHTGVFCCFRGVRCCHHKLVTRFVPSFLSWINGNRRLCMCAIMMGRGRGKCEILMFLSPPGWCSPSQPISVPTHWHWHTRFRHVLPEIDLRARSPRSVGRDVSSPGTLRHYRIAR